MLKKQIAKINSKKRTRGDIKDPKTFEIADRFTKYQRKTTDNILEMCRVVVEAKNREDFEDFCLLIGYDPYSSTIRKLHSIGLKYRYLISISDRLPPNWTVLYEISRMSESAIAQYLDTNKITSTTTTSKIEQLLVAQNIKTQNKGRSKTVASNKVAAPQKDVPNRTSSAVGFIAQLNNLEDTKALTELDKTLRSLQKMGFELHVSDELQKVINDLKTLELEMEVI